MQPWRVCAARRGGWLSDGIPTSPRSWAVVSLTSQHASAASLERIPGARVTDNGADEITITFAERIVLHGVLNRETAEERGPLADVDHIVITSLEVQKGGRR